MIRMRVREESRNRLVYRRFDDFDRDARQVFRDGFFHYMKALKKRANSEILRKPKGGKRRRNRRGRWHTASAPGETHANDTGTLRKSLSWKVNGWQGAEFGYGISSNAQNKAPSYAGMVELGTRFMKPRPSLRNAVKDTKRDIHFDYAVDQMVSEIK